MNRSTLALLATVLIFAACDDDAAGPTGDRLTRAEDAVIAGDVTARSDQVAMMPQAASDPDIDLDAHVATVNFRPSAHSVEINGAFKWSASDGRSGSCPIALDAVTDFDARQRTVEGSVCGHSIKETTSWN